MSFAATAVGIAVGAYLGHWLADVANAWITRRLNAP